MFLHLKGITQLKIRKLLTLVLVFTMLFSSFPITAFAVGIVDKAALTNQINAEFTDGASRTTYVKNEADYTVDSWSNYFNAIASAIAVESNLEATEQQVQDAINGILTNSSTLVVKELTAPGIPTDAKAIISTETSALVSWGSVADASGYEVYMSTTNGGTFNKITETTSTSYTKTGLSIGNTYFFKIRAYKTDGNAFAFSEYSEVVSVTPILIKPTIPTSFKATSASYNSIKTSWDAVNYATGYEIYRATSSTGKYYLMKTTASTSYTNISLIMNKSYYYKIRAYRIVGTTKYVSGYSTVVSAKPIPSTPANFKASRVTTSIKVSWGGVSGASGYELYRATSSTGAYSFLKRTTLLSYTNTGTTYKGNYYYKVRSYRMAGTTRVYSKWTSVKRVNHIAEEIYKFLSIETNRRSVHNAMAARNWGRGESNGCALFVSEALRRVGVNSPTNTRSIDQLLPQLRDRGWKKNTDYTKLVRGDICFTTDAYGNKDGRPTHTYIFMAWVTPGNYDYAYICDNQTRDFEGQIYHIRNIKDKGIFNGQGKDAFSFFMYNR